MAFLLWLLLSTTPVLIYAADCDSPTPLCTCTVETDGTLFVNCRYKNLTEIPQFNDTGVTYDRIDFASTEETGTCPSSSGCNRITAIPANAFANIRVKKIDISKNPLSVVDDFAFSGTGSFILDLSIEGTGTNNPPYSALGALDNLEALYFRNYGQAVMGQGTIFPTSKIKTLKLEKFANLYTIIPDVFNALINLEYFKMTYMNNLTMLPVAALENLPMLKKLEVSDTSITDIYDYTFREMSQLEDLIIQQNIKLTTIHQNAFRGANDTLKYITLKHNRFSDLSFLNVFWSQLSQLDLGYNPLGNIPNGAFTSLGMLDYLILQSCDLTTITSSTFSDLNNLHTLDISHNAITLIEDGAFHGLTELRINDQTSANTITIGANAFQGVESSLQHLLIENNNLNTTQLWSLVQSLTNLLELNIAGTSLSEIPDKVFRYNTILENLDVSYNNLNSINQASFFGPKTTLKSVNLEGNNLQTVNVCVLNDFPTKPVLMVLNNQLRCDCDLLWLLEWVKGQPDPETAAYLYVGHCSSPSNLAGLLFSHLTQTDICSGSIPVPTCPDLYLTTTTTTSTTSSTSSTTPTPAPTTPRLPQFTFTILHKGFNYITCTWDVKDKTYLTGFRIEIIDGESKQLGRDEVDHTFYNLKPSQYYTVCLTLEIENVLRTDDRACEYVSTEAAVTTTTSQATTEPQGQNLPLIIGVSVGGVLLVVLVIVIVYVLLKSNKAKSKPPPAVIVASYNATIPHTGGTAKRFHKKPEKEGATPDDIHINVISNGNLSNKDRISAGSYQTLNEKGVDPQPMPSTSNARYVNQNQNSSSNGHYTNAVEERPLPKAPNGARMSGGKPNHGYVNDEAVKRPETSTNEYSSIDNRY